MKVTPYREILAVAHGLTAVAVYGHAVKRIKNIAIGTFLVQPYIIERILAEM